MTLSERGRTSMGIVTTTVKPQTEPIRLELLGTTEYDSDNLTKIRPLFKGRVDKVYTTVGKTVKKGCAAHRSLQHGPGRGQERLRDQANSVDLRQEPA